MAYFGEGMGRPHAPHAVESWLHEDNYSEKYMGRGGVRMNPF